MSTHTGDAGGRTDGDRPVPPGVDMLVEPLLAGIDADEDRTRRRAGRALSLLAGEFDVADAVASGLVAHLPEIEDDRALLRTLATLDDRRPKAVQRAVADVAGQDASRIYVAVHGTQPWSDPTQLRADGGRGSTKSDHAEAIRRVIKLTDGEAAAAPVEVERDDADGPVDRQTGGPDVLGRTGVTEPPEPDERTPESSRAVRDVSTAREQRGEGTTTTSTAANWSEGAADGSSTDSDDERGRTTERSRLFTAIGLRSRVDDLEPTAPPTDRRFGTASRSRAVRNGTTVGVAVRVLPDPDGGTGLAPRRSEALSRWRRLAAVPGIVTVADWGDRPCPWAITPFCDERLADRDRPDPATALAQVADLAGALAAIHDRGIVHGGIDPRAVAYRNDDPVGTSQPLLDDVGLVPAYRGHVELSTILDPRYAAPEYWDGDVGGIDAATDVYGFGAVAYRLCTGRPPYVGDAESIRAGILDGTPPAPTDVRPALPDGLDDVLLTAMATRKSARHGTATRLHTDLARLRDRVC